MSIRYHDFESRRALDRFVALVTGPHPTDAERLLATISVHDSESKTLIEDLRVEMTLEGAKSKAAKVARQNGIADVLIFDGQFGR